MVSNDIDCDCKKSCAVFPIVVRSLTSLRCGIFARNEGSKVVLVAMQRIVTPCFNFQNLDLIFLIFHCFDRSISEPCSAGTYRPAHGTECVPCEEGTVSTETGAISCTSCDPGKQANSDKTKCGKCSIHARDLISMKSSVRLFYRKMRK